MKESGLARDVRQTFDAEHALPKDMLDWVKRHQDLGCSTIVMRQRVDSGTDIVGTWDLIGADARLVTASIDDTAHAEGRYLRGPTLFLLYAQMPDTRDFIARMTILIEGKTFSSSGETEAPNEEGIISMFMRHTDASMKVSLGHTGTIIEQYKGLLADARHRIEDLEGEIRKFAHDRDLLKFNVHEREMDVVKAKDDSKNSEFVREQMGLLVPVLANGFLKTKLGGRSLAVTDESLSRLMSSFTEAQMMSLSTTLTAEQMMTVSDLYLAYGTRSKDPDVAQAAAAAQREAHAHTPSTPSANGAPANGAPTNGATEVR